MVGHGARLPLAINANRIAPQNRLLKAVAACPRPSVVPRPPRLIRHALLIPLPLAFLFVVICDVIFAVP
jgi:hypothetical protein